MAAAGVDARAAAALRTRRRAWLGGTVAFTVGPFALAIALAPGTGAAAPSLAWLLFVGSSMHIGATAWFFTVRQVRDHMRSHATRYFWTPLALVTGWSTLAVALGERRLVWLLLGFFAWQFHHFQKQNLGVAALAASGFGARSLSLLERRALVGAGVGGIAALVGHPGLLQLSGVRSQDWLFVAGCAVFAAAVAVGVWCLVRRPAEDRPLPYVAVYLASLLFFAPVFVFDSPYAAVAGLTIAHGLQYLLLVGFLAATSTPTSTSTPGAPASVGLLVLLNIALALAVLLNWSSHLHSGGWLERAVFGIYLGLVSAHFVMDAGLWRLRDEFPRAFLTARLPFLLGPSARGRVDQRTTRRIDTATTNPASATTTPRNAGKM